MTANPPIMGYMQPFSIAGAIAPIAPADMKGRVSINDPAGFAALLGGTALTAPLADAGPQLVPPVEANGLSGRIGVRLPGTTGADLPLREGLDMPSREGVAMQEPSLSHGVPAPPAGTKSPLPRIDKASPDLLPVEAPSAAPVLLTGGGEQPATTVPQVNADAPLPAKGPKTAATSPIRASESDAVPAPSLAGVDVSRGRAALADPTNSLARAKPGRDTSERKTLPHPAPMAQSLIAMSQTATPTDEPKATPAIVEQVATTSGADADNLQTVPKRAPHSETMEEDQPIAAAIAQQISMPPAPLAATPLTRATPGSQPNVLGTGPTVVPPVMAASDQAALHGDAQSQMTGDDAKAAFEPATETDATQRADTPPPQSSREPAGAPKDFASALDASVARPTTEAPRALEAKPPVQPQPQHHPAPADPVVRASAPGHDMGIALSRHATKDGEQVVTLRLDPGELGRIEVRLAVDDDGRMTARISAEQRHTLDLIRRDTDTLVRTLNDAGVRADAQGFRFDGGGTQSGGQHAAWAGQQGQHGQGNGRHNPFQPDPGFSGGDRNDAALASSAQPMGPASGRVDLLA